MSKKNYLLPLFLVIFLSMLGIGIIIPVLSLLFLDPINGILPSFDFGMQTILLGVIISIYPLAQFFGAPILGALSDRYGRKSVLIFTLLGSFFGYSLFAFGIILKSFWIILFARIIDGLTAGNISVAYSSIADISNKKNKAKNFGLVGMAVGLGFIFGPFLGGKLSDATISPLFSYATPFIFSAILYLINILVVFAFYSETLKVKIKTKISLLTGIYNLKKAFGFKHLRVIFLVIFLLAFGFSFFTQFFQVYLIDKWNFNEAQIGNFFAFMGLSIVFTQGFIVRKLSKVAPERILKFSIFGQALAIFLFVLAFNVSAMYFILFFVAVFTGLTNPNSTALISNLTDKRSQGEIMGINQSLQSLAQAIPPLIAGFIVKFNIYLPTIFASLSIFIAGLIFVIYFNKKKEKLFVED